jgi:hypothetical protein
MDGYIATYVTYHAIYILALATNKMLKSQVQFLLNEYEFRP